MKVLYFNIFLEKNGTKTNYKLSDLFDFIAKQTADKRTVQLGSQRHIFLHSVRNAIHGRKPDGTALQNHEYINGNRTSWIGKYSDDKPFEGQIGTENIHQIDGDLFQPNTCLYIPDSYLFLMEYNFLGPVKGQIEEYLTSFVRSTLPNTKLAIRLEPIAKESIRTLLPASNSIKEIKITVRNDGFQLSHLFPGVAGSQATLLQKLFGNMIEVSNELDINTTTVIFKKSRYKREMDIQKIDDILSLLNADDKNLISAKVKFENPKTGMNDELDLKHDGYLTSEKSTGRLTGFENLASLLTEHYYDDVNRQADDKFYDFGNLLPIQSSEVSISLPD